MTYFHFIRPWALSGFIVLVMLLFLLSRKKQRFGAWQAICDSHLLKELMVSQGSHSKRLTQTCLFFLASSLLIALAGPTWTRIPQPVFKQQSARVVVLDLSAAMLAKDILPSRLTRAKFQIRDLLKHTDRGQVGMVVFTKEAFLVSPLTDDAKTINALLAELSPHMMPVQGHNIAQGLKKAQQLIEQAGYAKGQILLFTVNQADNATMRQARQIARQGSQLDVIGMATPTGAPIYKDRNAHAYRAPTLSRLDKDNLHALAQAGQGQFIAFNDIHDELASLLKKQAVKDYTLSKQNQAALWQDRGRYLLFLSIPLLLGFFRRGLLESMT